MISPIQELKIALFVQGLSISRAAREAIEGDEHRPLTLAEYASTSGISLELPGGIFVNAPLHEHNPNFVEETTPHVLDHMAKGFVILSADLEVPARPIAVPSYHNQTNPRGERYTEYAATHTDRVRISPIGGCAIACHFCNLPYELKYKPKDPAALVESIDRALLDDALPAKHALISGGTPRPEHYEYLNGVYQRVASTFPHLAVDVMMVPFPGLLDARRLKEIGIHGLSINMELFNPTIAKRIMRQKYEGGVQMYLDFIETAVQEFGPGRVRSLMMVGIEPLEDTLQGVEALAQRGCDPVLSPFRPDPSTPLRNVPPPSMETLRAAYLGSQEIVSRYQGVALGPRCIPCQHNTLTFPDDSGKYFFS